MNPNTIQVNLGEYEITLLIGDSGQLCIDVESENLFSEITITPDSVTGHINHDIIQTTHIMNPNTIQALNESILKWQDIVDGTNTELPGSSNCPLCKLFIKNKCHGCPVRNATGFGSCLHTPYENVVEQVHLCSIDSPEYRAAALRELNFLKSLLPQ